LRTRALRWVPAVAAATGGLLRSLRGTPAGSPLRHGARRRLGRLRTGAAGPPAPAGVSPWAPPPTFGRGRRGSDPVDGTGRGAAAYRRSGVVPPRQGGRALRAR